MKSTTETPALERGTLSGINSGPSGGKTTLYAQAINAHLYQTDFFVPGMRFPEGRIAIVQTDRGYVKGYQKTFVALGLHQHPMIDILNFVDDRPLHALTRPPSGRNSNDVGQLEALRQEIGRRLKGRDISTLILDLYDDFHTGSASGRKAGYDGRTNVQWSQDMNVAILAILYPFKQTTQKRAMRVQDRQSGVLQIQASMNWKFTIIDAEESQMPYATIAVKPAPGDGDGREIQVVRGTKDEGDFIGLFRPYTGPIIPSIESIIDEHKCGLTKAREIQKRLAAGEDSDWVY